MCLAMYLFTDDILPESAWLEERAGVWIHAVNDETDRSALEWPHEQKHMYYIGGYEGCGCGWAAATSWDEPEDHARKAGDRADLAKVLMTIDLKSSWLIVCWEGDQGCEMLPPLTLTLQQVRDPAFEFEECRRYVFAPQG